MTETTSGNPKQLRLGFVDHQRLAAAVKRNGERAVRQALGVSRESLTRALARLQMRRGTLLLITSGLPALEAASKGEDAEVSRVG